MSKVKSSSIQTATCQNMLKIHQKVWGLPAQTAIRAGEAIFLNRKSLKDICSKVTDSSTTGSSQNGQT